ncbi:MAG: DUF3500 domain-containing protein [Verrucomicrobia bacterium]|nr:MAG: DUF3500 domain-containing protein [Verrucomicrobiota bacterium]
MKFPARFGLMLTARVLLFSSIRASAQTPATDMADAANHFLAALTPEQQAKASFKLEDPERFNFGFIPRPRHGLLFKELSPGQRLLAHALLNSGLSQRGYAKAVTIMSLDDVLKELEQGRGPVRDPELYYVSIFGQPDACGTWGWRVEGHHLSLNFLVADGTNISIAPNFFGSNPGEVRAGPRKGLRVLGGEEELGRQLINSLDAEQRTLAVITNIAPREILTGTNRSVSALSPMGIPAAKLSPAQHEILHRLIEEYARRYRAELADADLKKLSLAGAAKIFFAWAGGTEMGQGHYYRVQGPTFLLEFDNTQNEANHIHTVWRDLENDFGEDALRRHYERTPHGN